MPHHHLFMLDTDMCSYIFRCSYPQMLHHLEAHDGALCISSVTAYELLFGGFKKNSPKLLKWIHLFLHNVQVVEWDQAVAQKCACLRAQLEKKGVCVALDDLMIAATALTVNATLVTNNTRHFQKIPGLLLENWTADEEN